MPSDAKYDRETIQQTVIRILKEMTQDWDLEFEGGIGLETRLIGDLAFESIDMVQLMAAIEEAFHRRDLPFERFLMQDGRYVDELTVRATVDFLDQHLGR